MYYLYPAYGQWAGWPRPPWGWYGGGYPGVYNSSNIIGSAVANQGINVIGSAGAVATQTAFPTVIF
jgi:hypothetical protein